MHAAFTFDPSTASHNCLLAAEKVGLRRIRLNFPHQSLRASVGNFFAADKVLQTWAVRHRGPLECEFEIVYADGRTLAGDYRFERGAAARPALMAFVRKTLAALCDGADQAAPVRGLEEGPDSFLAHYETEDFMSN
jgi:hypothetical protein